MASDEIEGATDESKGLTGSMAADATLFLFLEGSSCLSADSVIAAGWSQ
jgi:hypothetical protein